MQNLTEDEAHVLLDVISISRNWGSPRYARPWDDYTTEPGEDPKANETGWKDLLGSAQAKLETILNEERTSS